MRMLRLVLMLAMCGCLGAQTATHFRIAGTVVNDRNGEPVPFCHLSAGPVAQARGGGLQRVGQGGGGFGFRQETAFAEADARGRFTLEVPGEGRYRLTMTGNGFRQQAFEAHDALSTAVVLTRESPVYTVVFRATADAVIAGQVTDDAGEAVRNAQVMLYAVGGEAPPGMTARRLQRRDVAMTDDRGRYEFQGMPAGRYEVSVTARPWYATPNPPVAAANGAIVPPPDPSLDVVFPVTWYPGTEDEGSAEKIEMKYGERRHLDFRLIAVPAAHLMLDLSADQPVSGDPNAPGVPPGERVRAEARRAPQVQMLLPDGASEFGQGGMQYMWNQGHLDIGGLAPGTYRVTIPGATPDARQAVSLLHVTAGGTLSDAGTAVPGIPVTIRVDGDPAVNAGQVSLTDMATGQPLNRGGMQPRGGPGGPRRGGGGDADTLTLYAPPDSYEVTVNGRDSFLTGVSARGAQVTGRVVRITEGSAELVVHMAAGLATVEGTANRMGKPASGAMALLVPATMGDPAGIRFERRTQTDTDGGFQFGNVIPGQYILLVIDHGWSVNWRDPVALRPYLLQGEPMDLAAAATVHPVVKAVSP